MSSSELFLETDKAEELNEADYIIKLQKEWIRFTDALMLIERGGDVERQPPKPGESLSDAWQNDLERQIARLREIARIAIWPED